LAVVTGTSSGIGAAVAAQLLERGWRVVEPGTVDTPMQGIARSFGTNEYPWVGMFRDSPRWDASFP